MTTNPNKSVDGAHGHRSKPEFTWALELGRGLANFAACEGLFLAVTWWLSFSMAFKPLLEFQMAILLFASYQLPWIFVAGFAIYLYAARASPWRISYVGWFLPGAAIGAVSANCFLLFNCLER